MTTLQELLAKHVTSRATLKALWLLGLTGLCAGPALLLLGLHAAVLRHFRENPALVFEASHGRLLTAFVALCLGLVVALDLATLPVRRRWLRFLHSGVELPATPDWTAAFDAARLDCEARLAPGEQLLGFHAVFERPFTLLPLALSYTTASLFAGLGSGLYLLAVPYVAGPLAFARFWAIYPVVLVTAVLGRQLCLDPFVWAAAAVPLPILGWLLQPDGMPGWAAAALASLATCLALVDASRAGLGRVHLSTDQRGHSYTLRRKGQFAYLGQAPLCRKLDTSYAPCRPISGHTPKPNWPDLPGNQSALKPANWISACVPNWLPVGLALAIAAWPATILGRELLELSMVEEVSLRPAAESLEAGFAGAARARLGTGWRSVTSTLLCRSFQARCELTVGQYGEARAAALAALAGARELQGESSDCTGAAGREALAVVLQLGERERVLGRLGREAAARGLTGLSAELLVATRMAQWLAAQPGALSAREALEHARRAARLARSGGDSRENESLKLARGQPNLEAGVSQPRAPRPRLRLGLAQSEPTTLLARARLAARLVDSGRTALRLNRLTERPEQAEWLALGIEGFEAYEALLGSQPAGATATGPAAPAIGETAGRPLVEELFGLVHSTGSPDMIVRALQRHGTNWAAGPLRRAVVELAEDLALLGRAVEAERLLVAAESPPPLDPNLDELFRQAEQLLFRLRSAGKE